MTTQLSTNFSDDELNVSGTIPDQYIPNRDILVPILQWVRDVTAGPVTLTSVYRTPDSNAATFGSANDSQHLVAGAADGIAEQVSMQQLADIVSQAVAQGTAPSFGQFIAYASDPHFHISIPFTNGQQNQQLLYAYLDQNGNRAYQTLGPSQIQSLSDTAPNFVESTIAEADPNPDNDATSGENEGAGNPILGAAVVLVFVVAFALTL